MTEKFDWVALKDVHDQYGLTLKSARNAVAAGRFPVATYRLGGMIVIDRMVHERFFQLQRERGLRALDNNILSSDHGKGDGDA